MPFIIIFDFEVGEEENFFKVGKESKVQSENSIYSNCDLLLYCHLLQFFVFDLKEKLL